MRKIFYAILLTLALASAFAAQTRRGAQTGTRPRPSTGAAARPAPRPTPAATRTQTTGAQQTPPTAQMSAKAEDCGCEAGPLPTVLATVNGIKITQADLTPAVVQQIQALQHEVVDARKQILDVKINSILLEAEAQKRGVSNAKLFEDEVVNKTVRPTAADAQAYFTQNRQQIEQQAGRAVNFAEIKDQIVEYLLLQRRDEGAQPVPGRPPAAAGVQTVRSPEH